MKNQRNIRFKSVTMPKRRQAEISEILQNGYRQFCCDAPQFRTEIWKYFNGIWFIIYLSIYSNGILSKYVLHVYFAGDFCFPDPKSHLIEGDEGGQKYKYMCPCLDGLECKAEEVTELEEGVRSFILLTPFSYFLKLDCFIRFGPLHFIHIF